MTRYFFNLRNSVSVDDEEGMEFADLAAAHDHATKEACAFISASIADECSLDLDHSIEIADASGALVDKVLFGDVVRVTMSGRAVHT